MDGKYDRILATSPGGGRGRNYPPLVTDLTWQLEASATSARSPTVKFRLGADAHAVGDNRVEIHQLDRDQGYTRYDAFVALGAADGKWELSVQARTSATGPTTSPASSSSTNQLACCGHAPGSRR